jgi:hypothetical protein
MQIERRTFLEYLVAMTFMPVPGGSQEASGMWGFIAKVTLQRLKQKFDRESSYDRLYQPLQLLDELRLAEVRI